MIWVLGYLITGYVLTFIVMASMVGNDTAPVFKNVVSFVLDPISKKRHSLRWWWIMMSMILFCSLVGAVVWLPVMIFSYAASYWPDKDGKNPKQPRRKML